MQNYRVNEMFASIQGEGLRVGTVNLFIRFAGCNVWCRQETHGFDCDTDADTGTAMSAEEIVKALDKLDVPCDWIVLTGGEPALQVDSFLVDALRDAGYQLAIETNGTVALPEGIDWITVSPKVPEDRIQQRIADEVKYVLSAGQPIPQTSVQADHKLISPAFRGEAVDRETLEWCIELVRQNPDWRLSVQLHKWLGIR
jgi:organic radical activating enzyme